MVAPGFIREAGMFANTGVKLPPGVGTRSPQDVAAAVIRAIERNRAEVDVAPLGLRAGTAVASVAPGPAAWVQHQARARPGSRPRWPRGTAGATALSGGFSAALVAAASCSPVTEDSAAMISSASWAPSSGISGVAWTRTTTSSPSTSSSSTEAPLRVGVEIS